MDKSRWEYKKFEDALLKVKYTRKIQNSDYLPNGIVPVVSQEETFISGYWDNRDDAFKVDSPVVIFGDHSRVVKYVDFDFVLGADGVKILKPINGLNARFFYHFLKWYDVPSLGYSRHYKLLKEIDVPIPSLSEQQHIVEELDLLSSIIEKKKAQLNELDNLAQSLFYEMFGDPITNEKGWEVKMMKEACNEIGDGLHGTPLYDPNGNIAFINGNNLIDGKITITDRTQYVNETEAKKIFIKMDLNTVLLSINGTLGKTAIYNNENVVLGKSACYLRLSNLLTAIFVMALMNTHTFKDFLESNSSKSTIKNVGLKAIRNFKVILPPLALQQQFASKIEAIEHQKELIKQSIKEVETLFNSRMDYYFN